MPYKDPEAQRKYQTAWIKKNRQDWIDSQGAACFSCGRKDLPFEVDHIDPKTKVSHRIWSWSRERRETELVKCQLLCVKCHWEKTGSENATGRNHGTTLYGEGCRCETCVRITNEKKRARRAARKAAGFRVT